MIEVRFERVVPQAAAPRRQTEGAAGYDLTSVAEVTIAQGGRALVPTGLRVEIPPGYEGQIRPRSGLAVRCGVFAHFGTIDADYRGELQVLLFNLGDAPYTVAAGDRVAQLVIAPVSDAVFVEQPLGATARGVGGFGHTGR